MHSDPTGLYSPGLHRELTYTGALAAGLSRAMARDLAERVVGVDKQPYSQKDWAAARHAMCESGVSPAVCLERYRNYMSNELAKCDLPGLANGVHAGQDSMAGGHRGMHEYSGLLDLFLSPIEGTQHFIGDYFPRDDEKQMVREMTRDLIKKWKEKCACR